MHLYKKKDLLCFSSVEQGFKLFFFSKVGFSLVLWHINHCGLFNAKILFIH